MTLEQLEELMLLQDMTHVMNVLELHLVVQNLYEALKQYEPKLHDVMDKTKRKDKAIKNEAGTVTEIVPVSRLPLALQKKIVLMGAAFLGTPSIESTPEGQVQENMATMIDEIWEANKLDYKFMPLAKMVMSERHAAELWYTKDVDESFYEGYPMDSKFELSMKLIANSLGDLLYPVFDEFGVMIAFGRSYKTREIVNNQVTLIMHFDLYTADKFYFSKQQDNAWLFSDGTSFISPEKGTLPGLSNPIGKIPVIYYSQPAVEWWDVQELIERLETKMSNHADTNDYFDSPIVFVEGDIEGFAEKGERGKVLQGRNGSKVSYLTWDNAPESTKMEISNLQYFIHSLTHTPDISFENLKGLGKLTGITLKLLFMDAHLKAADKEPIFGEGIQRRVNYLKKAISVLDPSFKAALPMKIKPKFNYFMPTDTDADITTLVNAVQGGILSEESAVRLNPLVADSEGEIAALEKSKSDAATKAAEIAKNAPQLPPIIPPVDTVPTV